MGVCRAGYEVEGRVTLSREYQSQMELGSTPYKLTSTVIRGPEWSYTGKYRRIWDARLGRRLPASLGDYYGKRDACRVHV